MKTQILEAGYLFIDRHHKYMEIDTKSRALAIRSRLGGGGFAFEHRLQFIDLAG
jgi:hypothetical protein